MSDPNTVVDEREHLLAIVNRVFNTGPVIVPWEGDSELQYAIRRLGEMTEPRALAALKAIRDHMGGDYPALTATAIRQIESRSVRDDL